MSTKNNQATTLSKSALTHMVKTGGTVLVNKKSINALSYLLSQIDPELNIEVKVSNGNIVMVTCQDDRKISLMITSKNDCWLATETEDNYTNTHLTCDEVAQAGLPF